MTAAKVAELLRYWQGALGLDHWAVKFDPKETTDPNDCKARTWRSASYDRAAVWLASDWASWEPHLVEAVIVHELLHLQHRDTDQVFEDLDGQLHRDASSMIERRYEHAMEGFIERLSIQIVELKYGKPLDWSSTVTETP